MDVATVLHQVHDIAFVASNACVKGELHIAM